MPAGPWVVLCRCRQHAHAQDARPKGFQFFIVHLLTRWDMVRSYLTDPLVSNPNNAWAAGLR